MIKLIKYSLYFLLQMMPLVSNGDESVEVRLKTILSDFDKREESDDGALAHREWIKTPDGKKDVVFLAEHYDKFEPYRKYELPMELARTGSADVIILLKKSLADFEKGSSTLSGIYYACNYGHADERFKKELAPALIPWIGKSDLGQLERAIELLPQMDPELASKVFFKDEYLSPDAPMVAVVLKSCNDVALEVPHPNIERLLNAWKDYGTDPKAELRIIYGYRQAVRSLALHKPEDAMKIAENIILKNPDESENFSQVPLDAAGLTGLYGSLCEHAIDDEKFSKLPEVAQVYFAVLYFEADMMNGGINQALGNSTGDYFPLVRKGYEKIGDKRGLQFLDFMLKPFGPDGPSQDREKRNRQMDTMNPTYLDQEDALYDKWYELSKDDISPATDWLLNMHAARNADILKPLMKGSANR